MAECFNHQILPSSPVCTWVVFHSQSSMQVTHYMLCVGYFEYAILPHYIYSCVVAYRSDGMSVVGEQQPSKWHFELLLLFFPSAFVWPDGDGTTRTSLYRELHVQKTKGLEWGPEEARQF